MKISSGSPVRIRNLDPDRICLRRDIRCLNALAGFVLNPERLSPLDDAGKSPSILTLSVSFPFPSSFVSPSPFSPLFSRAGEYHPELPDPDGGAHKGKMAPSLVKGPYMV